MMSLNETLTGVQLAAALSEEIYRRNAGDVPVTVQELGCTSRPLEFAPAGLNRVNSDLGDTYYYSQRGFVGRVVEKNGTFYVVLRGTDSSEGFAAGAVKAGLARSQTALDPARLSDLGDWTNNILMGLGTGRECQADDAVALTPAAVEQRRISFS